MPKRIPVAAAKRLADEQKCFLAIVVVWDGEMRYVVTYGRRARGLRAGRARVTP